MELFEAIRAGDEGEVGKWLDADPGLLEETNAKGVRPLVVAALKRQLGVVKLLIRRGADVNATAASGTTALHGAAFRGHERTVAFLLQHGAQANRRMSMDTTPLMLACHKGHFTVARMLLQHMGGQALKETDNEGKTALHWASIRGHGEVVTLLLGQGAEASSRDASGETPIIWACKEGHLGVVQVLLRHVGGQALQEVDEKGGTALHGAALWGHAEIVSLLLGQGAKASRRDILGRTPLLCGCKNGHLGVVRVLARHMGEDGLKERYAGAWTVLHVAAIMGHEEVAALLVGMGAQVNSRTVLNTTPLMLACEKGHLGVVRMLAQHMGEEGLKETYANGRTVLHWAVEKGYHETVKLLLLAGADPTIADNGGRTPRALAEGEVERAECVAAFEVRDSCVLYPHTA
jgi:ankyrin repeat protein